jgi:EAL domain-containing protein (putative c-di-GMP-specific phosphodiesterase class I)
MLRKDSPANPRPKHRLGVSDKHLRRVRMLLLVGSSLVILVGVGWGGFFALRQDWLPALMDLIMIMTGAAATQLSLRGNLRAASLIELPILLVVICVTCVFIDVPTPTVPRSVHNSLIALGVCGYMLLRGENVWLRLGFPASCFAAFLVFGSGAAGMAHSPYILAPEIRSACLWSNNVLAILVLCIALYIMQADIAARNAMEADLRIAVAQGQFVLHYQPQVNEEGSIIGAEALVRWEHPERGMIPPGKFIPVAEENGLILAIGDWVLKKACAQLVIWSANPSTEHITLAINVSASQFRQPDFVAQVLSAVERSGVQPSRLKLELTESMLVKDVEDIVQKMTTLQAHGIGFSLDDFGTGFSSLSYLKRLPLDQLKIDQSFVRDLLTDPNDMAIARTVVNLGQSLGLSVIAEGVETQGQRDWLSANGCHAYQGYLFSKPLPINEFEAFIAKTNAARARPLVTPAPVA